MILPICRYLPYSLSDHAGGGGHAPLLPGDVPGPVDAQGHNRILDEDPSVSGWRRLGCCGDVICRWDVLQRHHRLGVLLSFQFIPEYTALVQVPYWKLDRVRALPSQWN